MIGAFVGIVFDGIAYGSLLFLISVGLSVTMGLMNFVNLAHGDVRDDGRLPQHRADPARSGCPSCSRCRWSSSSWAGAARRSSWLLYRRLYRRSHLDQVLFTIGLSFMAGAAATWVWGPSQQPVQLPAFLHGQITVLGIDLGAYRLFLVALVVAVTAAVGLLLARTRFGAQLRAASTISRRPPASASTSASCSA